MKLLKWLDKHIEELILAILLTISVIIVFLQVIMRYVFSNSLTWSEELARYIFIWLIYVGVSYAIKSESHLTIDAIDSILNEKEQIVVSIIADIIFVIFAIVLTYYSFHNARNSTRYSAALGINMGYVYFAPVFGFALSIVRLIQNLKKKFNKIGKLPREEG